jgi:hypothetical protein
MRAYRFTEAIVAVLAIAGLVGLVVWYALSVVTTAEPAVQPIKHPPLQGKACGDPGCHKDPHRPKSIYSGPCETCHVITSWANVYYTHSDTAMNRGVHPVIGCARCHANQQKVPPKGCENCHEPPHRQPSFGCSACHVPAGWAAILLPPARHLSLKGGHSGLTCIRCHDDPRSPPRGTCVGCHGPRHGGLTDCESCHDVKDFWRPVRFAHSRVWPLEGKHKFVQCSRCHVDAQFAATPSYCNGCHSVVHPDLTNCASCHTPAGWIPSTFRHSRVWSLTGAHADLRCTKCHPKDNYAHPIGGGSTKCVACHGPHHGGLTQCQRCHTTSAFVPSTFEHSSVWVLTGAHAHLSCNKCHPGGDFANPIGGGSTKCVACHGPHHGGLTQCQECHTTSAFVPSTFKHSSVWVLTGLHASVPCNKCHPGGNFAHPAGGGSTACVACHAHISPHGPISFSCSKCHTTRAPAWHFVSSTFSHPSSFPLNGAHQGLACTACHPSLKFGQASSACASCHGNVVPHVGPSNCRRCHVPISWNVVNFTHVPMTFHPASINEVCTNCHKPGGSAPWGNFTIYSCTPCHTDGRRYPPPGF